MGMNVVSLTHIRFTLLLPITDFSVLYCVLSWYKCKNSVVYHRTVSLKFTVKIEQN